LRFFNGLSAYSFFQSVLRQSAVLRSCYRLYRIFGMEIYRKPFGNDAYQQIARTDKKIINLDKNAHKR
jgi:hypothetical protein